MKKVIGVVSLMVFSFAVCGFAGGHAEGAADSAKADVKVASEVKAPVETTIPAEPQEVKAVEKKAPAKCEGCVAASAKCEKCVAAAIAPNVLAVKDGKALVCACKSGCKCAVAAEGKKCSCGVAVSEMDLTGKFVCEHCKMISAKAGKCEKCGVDLVEVKAKETAKDVEKPASEPVK